MNIIQYLFLPKGFAPILYRFFYYLPAIIIALKGADYLIHTFIKGILVYLLVEGLVCPSRNIINDLKDYKGDQRRGYRWERFVNKDNRKTISRLLIIKIILTCILTIIVNYYLLWVVTGLFVVQLIYDNLTKPFFPLMSIFTISIGYVLRSLSIFVAFHMTNLTIDLLFILGISFLVSLYQSLEWRINESYFIKTNNVSEKSGTNFFYHFNYKALDILRYTFTVIIQYYCIYILSSNLTNINIFVFFLLCLVISFLFNIVIKFNTLKSLKSIFAINFFVLVLFGVIISNSLVSFILVSVVLPYVVVYYSKVVIYNKKSEYFAEKLYDKESEHFV